MKEFWALVISFLVIIGAMLAMNYVNGGSMVEWLDDHTGAPNTAPRF